MTDPRALFDADFRRKMEELCGRGRVLGLDPAELVAAIFRWIIDTVPPEAKNEVVREALVNAIDSFLATRKQGNGTGPKADFVLQGVEGRRRLLALLVRAPAEYRVITDDGATWKLTDVGAVDRHHHLRKATVHAALDGGHPPSEVAAVLLELSASIFRTGMRRETFLQNAELWYDSASQSEASSLQTSPGGQA